MPENALAPEVIQLPGGRSAVAVSAPPTVSGEEVVAALELPPPRGVIVLNGGTAELSPELSTSLRRSLGDGLARVAREERLTVVTGGTDAGIFTLFGQALGDQRTAPCVGVVPSGRVTWPGRQPTDDDELVGLEPHHSHFLVVEGHEWGVETEAMLSLARALSARSASLAVVAGGGAISRREVMGHSLAGREIVVLADSGRFANELAGAVDGRWTDDEEANEIATAGRITVVRTTEPPSALAEIVRDRLDVERRAPRR